MSRPGECASGSARAFRTPSAPGCGARAPTDRARTAPPRALLFALMLVALLLPAAAPRALAAQDLPTPTDEQERLGMAKITRSERDIRNGRPGFAGIQFGWNGEMPAERWGPIRVWIDGGRSGFSGALVVSFRQDNSQSATIITPASGTPGRVLPIEVLTPLPQGVSTLDISLLSDRGRVVSSERFTRAGGLTPTGATTQGLASLIAPSPGLVLIVRGTRTEPGAAAAIIEPRSFTVPAPTSAVAAKLSEPERVEERWRELRATTITSEELSTAWTAYDGVEVLIVRDRDVDDVNPLALAAVREWVLRGGRLVVTIERPDAAYRRWLPDAPDADAAAVGELATFTTPPVFADDLKRQRIRHTERQAATQSQQDQIEEPEAAWQLSKSLRARPITISLRGQRRGWRATLPAVPFSASPTAADEPSLKGAGPGLVASGPVGFGFVTLVAFDPRDAGLGRSAAAALAPWRRVLADAAQPWLAGTPRQEFNSWGDYIGRPSGATPSERAAISRTANRAVETLAVGDLSIWAFVGLGSIMLALAFLLGPIDAMVLKRLRARHRAWITALGWIGIASLIAGIAPAILRGDEPSRLSRFETIDVLQESSADPAIARGPNPTIAFASGISALFSGPSGKSVFEGTDDGSWWRGVSSRTTFGGMGTSGALAPLEAIQRSTTQDGIVVRGSPLREAVQGQWMLRTLCDASKPSFVPRVELRGPENAKKISLFGLPDSARIERSALLLGTRRLFVKWEPHTPGDTVRRAEAESDLEPAEWTFWEFSPPATGDFWMSPPEYSRRMSGADTLHLPGASVRRWSIDTRLALGDYAMLLLEVGGLPPGVRIQGAPPDASTGVVVIRLVVPIND